MIDTNIFIPLDHFKDREKPVYRFNYTCTGYVNSLQFKSRYVKSKLKIRKASFMLECNISGEKDCK